LDKKIKMAKSIGVVGIMLTWLRLHKERRWMRRMSLYKPTASPRLTPAQREELKETGGIGGI